MKSRWIEHQGIPIFYVDFSNFGRDFAPFMVEIEAVLSVLESQPRKSVLCMTDVRNTFVSRAATARFKSSAPHVGPYIRKAAIIVKDVTALKSLIVKSLSWVGGRGALLFSNVEQAKDWLVSDA